VKRGASEARAGARIEALSRRWDLSEDAAGRLLALLMVLRDDPRAPTSVRDPAVAVDAHVADSLCALPWLESRGAKRVVDIGSGAGFPGLPLALARPDLEVDLVEAARRKGEFLSEVARRLEATRVRVVARRAEEWAAGEGQARYDTVLARAVGSLAELVEYAAPLLEPGGTLIAWKGARVPDEERRGEGAAEVLGMRSLGVERVEPYPESRAHNLHLYEKVRVTPEGFPRRPGMARKRPLE
jgi:16S rRNA (guanine527-N7)-methyltransferase